MKISRKVNKIGYSLNVVIPSEIADKIGLQKGDSVSIDFFENTNTITVEPVHSSCKTDAQAVQTTQVNEVYEHDERQL